MNSSPSILLVEDNDLDAEIFLRGLKKAQMTNPVVRARDGIEALTILQDHSKKPTLEEPFIILLDINMPRMNGHEFLEKMRADPDISARQVFVFTTSNAAIDITRAQFQNASGYLVKPNGTAELVTLLSVLKDYWSHCRYPPAQQTSS